MNDEQNMQRVADFFQAMTDRNFDYIESFLAPEHQFFFPLSPVPLGRDAHIGMNREFGISIPDVTWHIDDQFVAGDKVVTRGLISGTHQGDFQGVPATGNAMSVKYINIIQLENGMNLKEWDSLDTLSFMQQLGAVPPPR